MRKRMVALLEILDGEIQKAQKRAEETRIAANEIAASAAASPSQSGDREHSAGQALITKHALLRLQAAKEDVEKNIASKTDMILPPCFIEVEIDGTRREFYFVKHPLHINEISFVSENSTFGGAIVGKKAGEAFEVGNSSGKIISVE